MRKAIQKNILSYTQRYNLSTGGNRSESNNQSIAITHDTTDAKVGNCGFNTSFSSRSRQSIMIDNLKTGIEYKTKQYDNLSRINHYLNDIFKISRSSENNQTNAWKIYLQSIASLSEEKYLNLPLFSGGTELPIRVHLILSGIPQTFEFSVCSLLNRVHIKSLMYSGPGTGPPTVALLNSCLTEVMDELLLVSTERTRAKSTLEQLQILSITRSKLILKEDTGTKSKISLLERIYFILSGLFKQKLTNA